MKKVNMRCRRARMPNFAWKRTSSSCAGGLPKEPRMTLRLVRFPVTPWTTLRHAMPPVVTSMDFSPDGTSLAVTGFHEALIHKADGSGLSLLEWVCPKESNRFAFPHGKKLGITGGQPGRMGSADLGYPGSSNCPRRSPSIRYTGALGLRTVNILPSEQRIFRCNRCFSGKQVVYMAGHDDWVRDTVFQYGRKVGFFRK